jgi:hypothetical protein
MHEENNDYAVPTKGLPLNPWNDLSPSDQHNSQAFTYFQCLGKDAKYRCLNNLCVSFLRFLKIKAKDMTIATWASAFTDASTPGSLIFPTLKGRELQPFGADLARSSPTDLSLAHEWVKRTHLRPQTHGHAWLGTVSVFGPLCYLPEPLITEVLSKSFSSDEDEAQESKSTNTDPKGVAFQPLQVLVDLTPTLPSPKNNPKSNTRKSTGSILQTTLPQLQPLLE